MNISLDNVVMAAHITEEAGASATIFAGNNGSFLAAKNPHSED